MPNYLIYHLNPVSGHIDRSETLHAGDDVSAVHALQGRRFPVPVELWRDGRKVSRQDGPPGPFQRRVPAPTGKADGQARGPVSARSAADRPRSRNSRPSG